MKRNFPKKKVKKTKKLSLTGIISISSKGTGYVALGGYKDPLRDPEVDYKHLNTALNGDLVEIVFQPKNMSRGGRQTAEVVRIIERAKMRFTGVLGGEKELIYLKPDDPKMYTNIIIPKGNLGKAKIGDKVYVEITSWKHRRLPPEGKVIKVLGRPGDNNTEMLSIALEKGFDSSFPPAVEREAASIKKQGEKEFKEKKYIARKDFTKVLTFTIDPKDAKDFDDAISFREIKDGKETLYEVGIHIADVTHYVKPGSLIDKLAYERGTSVYLVDRTIPMLPEVLSNDLCSLVPNKDRLAMSAVFTIDKNAKVKSEWFGRTVIHSKKRFTYEEAEESIQKSELPYHKELHTLNEIAKKLTKERFKEGAISLEQEEVRFVLNMYGIPVNIVKKERGQSNRLIEELMLLANKHVAKFISGDSKNEKVSMYRVHDLPSKEKTADLAYFLQSLGYSVPIVNGVIPATEINKLLKSLEGKPEADTVHRAVVKSMAKAIYSTKNIGHYGLAFTYYTHFTSPIRRYPDIIVHRLLTDALQNRKIKKERLKEYEEMARQASEQEKRASEAERSSIKYKQVEYMSKHVGKTFEGIVSGITRWGIYVEEVQTKCEGMVRMRDLNDDFYVFNEKKMELVGERTKKRYRLGDRVKIKVLRVDLEKKTIDYILV